MAARIAGSIVAGLAAATVGIASGFCAVRGPALPSPPLVTPWPAVNDCPHFDRLELAADDRVQAVDWRGPGDGASFSFDLGQSANTDGAADYFFKGANTFPCGDLSSLCILYPRLGDKVQHQPRNFLARRLTRALSDGLPVGKLESLVLRPDPRLRSNRRTNSGSYEFGLRLILRCSDPSRASLYWACDARSCVLRTFRRNPGIRDGRRWHFNGPFQDEWMDGRRSPDLHRLLDLRPGALRGQRGTAEDLTRDLLKEMDAVLAYGCGEAACSARISELRSAARALVALPALPLGQIRIKHEKNREEGLEESGWTARFGRGEVQAELGCARHYHHESAENPPHDFCQVSVFRNGVPLGDYFPYWFQQVEIPGGGSVELRGGDIKLGSQQGPAWGGDQIVITGSALATRP